MRFGNSMIGNRMMTPARTVLAAAACLLMSAPGLTAQSSKNADPCKQDPKSTACANASKSGSQTDSSPSSPSTSAPSQSLHDQFPFPTEDSKHGGGDTNTNSTGNTSNGLPAMPTDPVPDPPASSEKPLNLPPGASGGSSSSSSGGDDMGSSSSKPDDDDDVAPTTAAPDAPIKAKPLKDLGSHADTSAARAKLEKTRVADDLKVARFYLNDGNNMGAYLRYKDAVDHDPEDPDARFGLAETANKLNKRDEAVQNYQAYLNIDGGGDHDRATRQALAKLGAPPK